MEADRKDKPAQGNTVSIEDYRYRNVSPIVALYELYDLLELYSPMWYPQESRLLARAALRQWHSR